jgi:hypothetical protein
MNAGDDPHRHAGHPIGDRRARQRFLVGSVWFTVPGMWLAVWAACSSVPPFAGMEHAADRLLLALRWLPAALLPYAAVCIVIASVRLFQGAHNLLLGDTLMVAYRHGGADSLVATYRALRERHYGRGTYDFSDRPLADLGANLLTEGMPADATAVATLNVEMNPESPVAVNEPTGPRGHMRKVGSPMSA